MEAGRSSHVKICYSFPQLKRHFALYCAIVLLYLAIYGVTLRHNAQPYENIASLGRHFYNRYCVY